jgi:DNA-binding MarR family transcriptional regulator
VVNNVPDDTQLEQLLTQLLRAVSPALGADRPRSAAADTVGGDTSGDTASGDTAGDDATGVVGASPQAAPPEAYALARPRGATGAAASPDEARAASGADGSGRSGHPGGSAAAGPRPDGAGLPSITGSEARALIELMSARGIAQGELAALLGLDKSTVSRLASGLERKGWIRRGRDEGNQRYVRLYLTAEGAQIGERVWQAWQSRQARILAALSAAERAGLSAGLRGLVRGLTAEGLLSEARGGGGES